MAFTDRFGVTKIFDTTTYSLSVSYDGDEEDTTEKVDAILLFRTPEEHFHIPLNRSEVVTLASWLDEFLKADLKEELEKDFNKQK